MAMWGLFQVINVVVLLNVCVALMNNTMIIINEEQCSTILTLICKNIWSVCTIVGKGMYFHTWDLGCWGWLKLGWLSSKIFNYWWFVQQRSMSNVKQLWQGQGEPLEVLPHGCLAHLHRRPELTCPLQLLEPPHLLGHEVRLSQWERSVSFLATLLLASIWK